MRFFFKTSASTRDFLCVAGTLNHQASIHSKDGSVNTSLLFLSDGSLSDYKPLSYKGQRSLMAIGSLDMNGDSEVAQGGMPLYIRRTPNRSNFPDKNLS